MANAIHPDVFKAFKEAQVTKEPTTVEEAVREEDLYAELALSGVWNYLKKYILDLEDVLDSLVKASIEGGASFEEIGQKTIVSELAKSFLQRVIEKVEDARIAHETTS